MIRGIISNLSREKYDITVLTLFAKSDPVVVNELVSGGVRVIHCEKLSRLGCMLGFDSEFRSVVKKNTYDVIHTHGLIPDILASRIRTKAIRISTIHNNMYDDYPNTYGKLMSSVYIPLHLLALKHMDACVCCSRSIQTRMQNVLPRVLCIRNGVEKKEAKTTISREVLGIPEYATVFIYTGRLHSSKRTLWMVEQFKETHSANEYLLVLGKGDEEELCVQAADNHIKVLGFQSDPAAYLKISDVYVSASRSEGFSIAVAEALSMGLELMVSDIPSHREVFDIEPDIYIGEVFSATPEGFVAAMNQLRLNHSLERKKRIGAHMPQHLSGKNMTDQYEMLYQKIK